MQRHEITSSRNIEQLLRRDTSKSRRRQSSLRFECRVFFHSVIHGSCVSNVRTEYLKSIISDMLIYLHYSTDDGHVNSHKVRTVYALVASTKEITPAVTVTSMRTVTKSSHFTRNLEGLYFCGWSGLRSCVESLDVGMITLIHISNLTWALWSSCGKFSEWISWYGDI